MKFLPFQKANLPKVISGSGAVSFKNRQKNNKYSGTTQFKSSLMVDDYLTVCSSN